MVILALLRENIITHFQRNFRTGISLNVTNVYMRGNINIVLAAYRKYASFACV